MASEYLLQHLLLAAFETLQTQPDATNDFLGALAQFDPDKLAQARAYFATTETSVILSYPTQPPPRDAAVVAILLGAETQQNTPLGGFLGEELEEQDGSPISLTQYFGANSRTTLQFIVCAYNADLCVWISRAIRWALLAQRDVLSNLGLTSMQISLQDLQPDNRWGGDLVLRRVVSVTLDEVEYVGIGYGTFIKAFVVENEDPPGTYPEFIDT